MLELCRRPLERCFWGGSNDDGLMWHMDLKPHASGDYSIAVVQANSSLEDQGQVFTSPSATFVGVYDGHGGPEASRFITNHLFSFLRSKRPLNSETYTSFFLSMCSWSYAAFNRFIGWKPRSNSKRISKTVATMCGNSTHNLHPIPLLVFGIFFLKKNS